jgi:hypothetical protein
MPARQSWGYAVLFTNSITVPFFLGGAEVKNTVFLFHLGSAEEETTWGCFSFGSPISSADADYDTTTLSVPLIAYFSFY